MIVEATEPEDTLPSCRTNDERGPLPVLRREVGKETRRACSALRGRRGWAFQCCGRIRFVNAISRETAAGAREPVRPVPRVSVLPVVALADS